MVQANKRQKFGKTYLLKYSSQCNRAVVTFALKILLLEHEEKKLTLARRASIVTLYGAIASRFGAS